MEVKVLKVGEEMTEVVEIRCHRINAQVSEIVAFVQSRQGQISGACDGMQYEIPIVNLYYVEAVEGKVFLYSAKQVYETKQKLYEIEHLLEEKQFLRVSKSVIVNLMKIKAIKPALNGRFGYSVFIMPLIYAFAGILPQAVMYSRHEPSIKEVLLRKFIQLLLIECLVNGIILGEDVLRPENTDVMKTIYV